MRALDAAIGGGLQTDVRTIHLFDAATTGQRGILPTIPALCRLLVQGLAVCSP